MTDSMHDAYARRLITEKCLIAADVDKTILAQLVDHKTEANAFFRGLAPQLVDAARQGTNVAFVTGNSMDELCSRVLRFLVHQLAYTNELSLISQFHFFCNSGGVYFHFPKALAADSEAGFLKAIISRGEDGASYVNSKFVHGGYLARTLIFPADVALITRILDEAAQKYLADVTSKASEYERTYDLRALSQNGQFEIPVAEARHVHYRSGASQHTATVQVTLKPVLSFRHAHKGYAPQLVGNDIRTAVIRQVQGQLDRDGLGRYVARPGGRGSIDVTLERLDKAYALEFLIDYLRVEGNPRNGQQFGSNTIYFGDEVISGGGNDYPVTRIPGLLVFAVNTDKELIPASSTILVPSTITEGPDATTEVLIQFNQCVHQLIGEFSRDQQTTMTAIDALKHRLFTNRIEKKISNLKRNESVPIDDWAMLHTFVTLMSRDDSVSRYWLSLLVKELDGIMMQPSSSWKPAAIAAIGTSHPS